MVFSISYAFKMIINLLKSFMPFNLQIEKRKANFAFLFPCRSDVIILSL